MLFHCVDCQGDMLVYSNGGDEIRVLKSKIVGESMKFLSARSELTKENVEYDDVVVECSGPIFSNEMNALLIYLIDALDNQSTEVFHVGGQAMYSYIRGSQFSNCFKKMLEIVDDDHNIMNGVQLNGMEIIPAHFFRIAGYSADLLSALKGVFQRMDAIAHINKKKGDLFKQGFSHTDASVRAMIDEFNREKKVYDQLLQIIANHPEITTIPLKTMKEGTLCELYQSQLDLYYQMSEGFNPKNEWGFLLEQSLDRIKSLIDGVLSSYRKK